MKQHKNNPNNHSPIEQVNQWEEDSVERIKQTAEECRQTLIKLINKFIIQLDNKLNDLAKQIKEIRQENEFNEMDLNYLKEKFTKLQEQLNKPRNISIIQQSTSFINKISVMIGKYCVIYNSKTRTSKDELINITISIIK